ncbi:hypothetical protein BRARA_K00313, partial [Brassica rapa]
MEKSKRNLLDEEAKASLGIWRYVFGFADIAAAKCAIDLKVPEAIENHPSSLPVTLAELSVAVSASPSHLHRIMRFLVHQGSFKQVPIKDGLATGYTNTPLSRLMMITKRDSKSLAPLVLFETTCHELFDGVNTMVDVGACTGETMGILVKEFPWIKGFNFDLPHVIQVAQVLDGVENVGGDIFDYIPKCDAVFIK